MKNYLTYLDDNELFIEDYDKIGNRIQINFADGSKLTIPYTSENEGKILDKMNEQIKESNKYMAAHKIKVMKSASKVLFSLSVIPIDILLLLTTSGISQMLGLICGSWFALSGIIFTLDIAYHKSIIKDIEKNLLFLNNRKKLNEEVKENEKTLLNVKDETKEMVLSTPLDEPVFTANSIRKLKYKELKTILENIKYQEKLKTFEFENSENEEYNPQILSLMKKYDENNN